MLWERLWPALAILATALGLFLAFSWAGLWLVLPPLARAIGLLLFVVVTAIAAAPLAMLRLPSAAEGLRRLDRSSGEAHRPATAVEDEMAANRHDPVAQALWHAHIERALLSARKLKAGWPQPRLALRDPIALRALVLILAVATFFAAGGERVKRVTAAFDWTGVVAPANFRIDAWVTPPVYTGRPPVMLAGLRPGETAHATAPVSVPAGSQLVIRSTGNVRFDVVSKGGLVDAPPDPHVALPAGSAERRLLIKGDGSAVLHGVGGGDLTWTFTAIPDRAPTIELLKDPERQARGSLRLDYKMDDDYGVVEAHADIALKDDDEHSPSSGSASVVQGARIPAHAAAGAHPRGRGADHARPHRAPVGRRQGRGDAGRARRGRQRRPQRGGRVRASAAHLRQAGGARAHRAAPHPGARRQCQAAGADRARRAHLAPEKFTPETAVYLGLRAIYYDLAHAKTDDQLREVVARLWDMATQLEDGNVSQSEQALRAAQDALRQALERGATDQELKKLMDQLRAAMDKYLQALAEEMRKNPQQLARPLDRNTRMLSQRDLKSMLDRLENLARSGNKEAARRLLDELQSMLENLQTARPGAQGDQGDDDMMSALDELGDMIRKQQQLRDKTFKQGQDMRRDRQRQQQGQGKGQGKQQLGDLRQDQQGLRDRLNKLLEQLRQHGLGNPGQDQQGQGKNEMGQLGDAGEAMGEAEGELGQGEADSAVDSQGRALEAMRKGAQGLAQQMQQNSMGMGPGPGQPGRNGRARAQQDTDPLGRPLRGRDYGDDVTVKVPGEIDAQRARRILEELRKRFGESGRPQLELDYIERLLKDF